MAKRAIAELERQQASLRACQHEPPGALFPVGNEPPVNAYDSLQRKQLARANGEGLELSRVVAPSPAGTDALGAVRSRRANRAREP